MTPDQNTDQSSFVIDDAGYRQTMSEVVLPFLHERKQEGSFARVPGQTLVYEHYSVRPDSAGTVFSDGTAAKGDLVLVHGFTEDIAKFYETVWYFLRCGLNVWLLQQRGHGRSWRGGIKDPSLVHFTNYRDLLEDLHYFVAEIVKPDMARQSTASPSLPLYLFGHSMGGGISALYLETWPEDFKKAILSSPMMEISGGGIPVPLAEAFARLKVFRGRGADYMPGARAYSREPDFEGSCTNCRERYDDYLALANKHVSMQMSAASIQAAQQFLAITRNVVRKENCAKVRADVLLFQAGRDNMVLPGGQNAFISAIPSGRLIPLPKARHEIYRCTKDILEVYWKEIRLFLDV